MTDKAFRDAMLPQVFASAPTVAKPETVVALAMRYADEAVKARLYVEE